MEITWEIQNALRSVDIRLYRVIYNAIEEVQAAMKGLLAPKFKETVLLRTCSCLLDRMDTTTITIL